ncbi:adenine deaminase [Parafilimonas sp.]|uniref:adenine deaminase n=1 Tax=Parafilimonas sp. TaxID=1969739 RepID=UPI0039E50780
MSNTFSVKGNYVNIKTKAIHEAQVFIEDGKIAFVEIYGGENKALPYILPGFIDSHVHIESSMLAPSEFARLAVVHGTVATVSDPHEIANVCGMKGVEFMIENGRGVKFKFNFGAPSCVPATVFETAGASLDSDDVEQLLQKPEIKYLSEMMNFPGVLMGDDEVIKKIAAAKKLNKPVDGHAPGLRGEDAKKYIEAGISTDHECFTKEEALDKLQYGMKIIIREGSAARNFEALIDLLNDYPNDIMFCSDDKHPDSLAEGHINKLCERAVAKGIDVFNVLLAACVNPVEHYKLDIGLLNKGDAADFVVVKDLTSFDVLQTYINGELAAENGITKLPSIPVKPINNFSIDVISESDVKIETGSFTLIDGKIPVIEALNGQLITNKILVEPTIVNNEPAGNVENDILKIVVVNRYGKAPVAKAFIKNIGLKQGAIASSVAHDSHNIVAVGCDDKSLTKAINLIIEAKGGVSCVDDAGNEKIVALPVAGLMSMDDGYTVAADYTEIDKMAKALGSGLSAPFMTLSFMALLVIPHIKLSDKGLFNGDTFSFF